LTAEDIERVYEYCQDPDIQRWTLLPSPYRRSDAAEFVLNQAPQWWEQDVHRAWGIREMTPDGPYLAGSVGLRLDGEGSADLGYLLAPDCRGRGLGTAAVRLATRHALDPGGMGMRRVIVRIFVGNWSSRALVQRAGFSLNGTVRSEIVRRGRAFDCWMATMIPSDAAITSEAWTDNPVGRLDPTLGLADAENDQGE